MPETLFLNITPEYQTIKEVQEIVQALSNAKTGSTAVLKNKKEIFKG